tara:strand:- start:298 stop:462 length:165 start_codon:yes stop_codon:yes gene_type:complete
MIGTLWKCRKARIFILKEKYTTRQGNEYYVFISPSGRHVTLRAFFVDRGMAKIT